MENFLIALLLNEEAVVCRLNVKTASWLKLEHLF